MDATLTQAHLHVPPDTAVPKKHLTLKKLRKAQRLREEVKAGQPDNSHSRCGIVRSDLTRPGFIRAPFHPLNTLAIHTYMCRHRVWPGLDMDAVVRVYKMAETLVAVR